jgi:hypothetical protein
LHFGSKVAKCLVTRGQLPHTSQMDIVSRVKALSLPLGKYCVFGSGVLEVHGIRKAKDVDILIDEELYQELRKRGWKRYWFFWRLLTCKALKKGDVECFTNCKNGIFKIETADLIRNAQMIDGVPFMHLKELKDFKLGAGRNKDVKDVRLIEEYLAMKSSL